MNPLNELLELAQKKDDLEEQMLFKVAKARAEGHSWQAIANVIGGTKQRVQQRYGKQIDEDQLLEQGMYECSCGWTLVYPGWESREALEDITDHERVHEDQAERDDYGTEPAELDQLGPEASKIVDVPAPAPVQITGITVGPPHVEQWPAAEQLTEDEQLAGARAMADKILGEERAAKAAKKAAIEDSTPRRTAAPQVKLDHDSETDMDRVESGELDTAGNTIDWTGVAAPKCLYCGKGYHYEGKNRNMYFWIYPGCNPTTRDQNRHKG